jgi:hypothetical protein
MEPPLTSPPSAAGSAAPPPVDKPPASACDLTGRWLLTLHKTTDSLGNLQTAHTFLYYEIEQQADALTVGKSLFCGSDVIGGGAFAVVGDFSGAQPGQMRHVSHSGRKGSSAEVGSGCQIDFAKQYQVVGATVPYYLDPATVLPNADQKAVDGMPGWEDWDEDGNPGITGVLSGTVSGKIFTASREWTSWSGSAPDVAKSIRLPLEWDAEPNVMAYDGSPLLGSSAVRSADPNLHFVQLARLQDDQAIGEDAAICAGVRMLAPTLTPEAAANM